MSKTIEINGRKVGHDQPAYIIGEIGINHNGDMSIAKRLIKAAADAGMDAVKFQKRTPELCVPDEQKGQMRATPWGYITYLDYRYKVEFGKEEYQEIDQYCQEHGISWFASAWDMLSVDFMEDLNTCCYKVASASLTDHDLLKKIRSTGKPMIISTGMSTMEQIEQAVENIGEDNMLIMHATSAYPCPPDELNLKMIQTLRSKFDAPIGYSGHEVGLVPSAVAVAMGACAVERHITLDRALWGSDQAASVEPGGLQKLVKYIRVTEQALGDGVKHVYESEMPSLRKLRRV
ncbi:MAG: N-acetylneuraminate synthase family protein [Anaerolineaceae bacterium]|nr:N-acetylneuraminate synthase family protein [Anaerolineaceae bacterium]